MKKKSRGELPIRIIKVILEAFPQEKKNVRENTNFDSKHKQCI